MLRILRRVEDELGDLKVCWVFEVDGFCEEWLPERGNYSFFPRGGMATVDLPDEHRHAGLVATMVATRFAKLRLCPCTLLAKTNDITFTTIDGIAFTSQTRQLPSLNILMQPNA